MTRIIPFKVEHLECMDIREHEREMLEMTDYLKSLQERSIACTGIVDGRIMCCGGVAPYRNGNSDVWLIPSVHLNTAKFTFTRELRKWLFQVREDLSLTRMQTFSIEDDLHNRWMRFLGFTKEGVMRKYNKGMDYGVWGRIWE